MGKFIRHYKYAILQGMAQSVDMFGFFQRRPKRERFTLHGPQSDWEKIGGDFRRAIEKVKHEVEAEQRANG